MKTAANISNATFVIALCIYFASMSAYFGYVTWKNRRWLLGATALLSTGWALHLVAIVSRVYVTRHAPWGNMYEFSMAASFLMITAFLFVGQPRFRLAPVGGYVTAFAGIVMAVGWVLYAEPGGLQPALRSNWLTFHVALVMTGSSLLLLGGLLSALYLIRSAWETRHGIVGTEATGETDEIVPGRLVESGDVAAAVSARPEGPGAATAMPEKQGLIARLPSADRLDRAAFKIIMFAFPIWTLGVIAGAIWGEQAWGRYWGWDPKETWSFIVWVIFAAYLHARATRGWKGRGAAIVAVIGAAAILFNFYAVNLWIAGLHSYAGV